MDRRIRSSFDWPTAWRKFTFLFDSMISLETPVKRPFVLIKLKTVYFVRFWFRKIIWTRQKIAHRSNGGKLNFILLWTTVITCKWKFENIIFSIHIIKIKNGKGFVRPTDIFLHIVQISFQNQNQHLVKTINKYCHTLLMVNLILYCYRAIDMCIRVQELCQCWIFHSHY